MNKVLPISVIMSVYKEPAEWLCQSIDSILNQTFPDFEFIIICDNPKGLDNIALLKKYAANDNRIKLLFNEENIGLTKSLNKGLAVARGKYIARMDADDISMPKRFEKQIAYLEKHPEVIVLGTNIKHIGHNAWLRNTDSIKFDNKRIKVQMLFGNCFAHSSVFVRAGVLKENNIRYDESFRQSQDYRLWEVLSDLGDFACLREKLLMYRLSENQISNGQGRSQFNHAIDIRYRLQEKWLRSIGYSYTTRIISDSPMDIVKELRKNGNVRNSLEYKAFLQHTYLTLSKSNLSIIPLALKDVRFITPMNFIRILVRALNR